MHPDRSQSLIACYRDGLLNSVLPFWLEHGLDTEHGGIITSLDRDGSWIDTDKGLWQQARFAWLLGKLSNLLGPRDDWTAAGIRTLEFIEKHGFATDAGRMWFQVTRDGQPLRRRRYAFTESFAAIAFGEWHRATGQDRYRELALRCFHVFVQQMSDPPLAERKFTAVRPTRGLGFPMILLNTAQELRDSLGWPEANAWIDRAISDLRTYHVSEAEGAVLETVGKDGSLLDHFDGRTLNPGHAIEGAWFVLREAQVRHDADLKELGLRMLDWMWERGWDRDYGGLLYFVDLKGLPVQEYWHDMKFWWPHNEAILATLLAYLMTGNQRYAEWHEQVHDWTHAHFPDPEWGEWFGYLHRDGRLSVRLKGNRWKGPFHIPRMQLLAWQWLEEASRTHVSEAADS